MKKRKEDLERFLSLLNEKRLEKKLKEENIKKDEKLTKKTKLSQPDIFSSSDTKSIISPDTSTFEKKPTDAKIISDVLVPHYSRSTILPSSKKPSIVEKKQINENPFESKKTSTISSSNPVRSPSISINSDYYSIVYIYDIFAKDKRLFNRTKRMFYYYLNKLPLSKDVWKSKSTIAVSPTAERMMDSFFSQFGSRLVVYKIRAQSIEQLE